MNMRFLIGKSLCLMLLSGYAGIAGANDLPRSIKQNNVETFQLACPGNAKNTTLDINDCLAEKTVQIIAVQEKYENAARNRLVSELKASLSPDQSQRTLDAFDAESMAWEALRDKATTATYTHWEQGSIRNAMSLKRNIEIRKLRIHDVWLNWMQYMDSTPSILPEPRFIDVQ